MSANGLEKNWHTHGNSARMQNIVWAAHKIMWYVLRKWACAHVLCKFSLTGVAIPIVNRNSQRGLVNETKRNEKYKKKKKIGWSRHMRRNSYCPTVYMSSSKPASKNRCAFFLFGRFFCVLISYVHANVATVMWCLWSDRSQKLCNCEMKLKVVPRWWDMI